MSARRRLSVGERLTLVAPWLWLTLFFFAPFLIVVKISLSRPALAQPPYEPVFDFSEGLQGLVSRLGELGLDAWANLTGDSLYLDSWLSSLRLAAIATLLTLCVAYPLALGIARAPPRLRGALVVLAVAPFWTSFIIRVYAWIAILRDEGLLNHFLMAAGLISEPLHLFATEAAVLVGIVYSYLPFMVLPLYNSVAKQDPALLEAAADLGASPLAGFWTVTFPLSRPGIVAGSLLVFIPAVGEFVIPDLLGGSDTLMIGRTLWSEFFDNRDWPTAAAVAILLLAALVVPLVFYEKAQMEDAEGAR